MEEQVAVARPPGSVDHLAGRRLASWRRRAAGFGIDAGLISIVPLAFFVAYWISLTPAQRANINQAVGPISFLWFALAVVLGLVFVVAYQVWFIGRRGQTPGMRRMRIRLSKIDAEGYLSDLDFSTARRRCFSALLWAIPVCFCALPLINYLSPLRDDRNQCMHDKRAGTVALEDLM